MSRRRTVAPRPARRTHRPSPTTTSEAERRLLSLARELGGLGRDALPRALRALATAYAPDAPLSRAVALAWAREQVRLALQELVEATPPSARGGVATPPATLAWLLLAAAEALAQEPPSAVPDRLKALTVLTGREVAP